MLNQIDEKVKKLGIEFDLSVGDGSVPILYFKDGFPVAEVQISLRGYSFCGEVFELDIFDYRKKLK